MNIIYNATVSAVGGFLKLYRRFLRRGCKRKFPRFAMGQSGLLQRVAEEMERVRAASPSRPTIWFHAASLGEYAVARPLIGRLKAAHDVCIVLTFFSPTGYEALDSCGHPDVDCLFYLPLDTRRNAKAFLDAVKPDKAVFVISEYWPNYLQQLKFASVPTYLVSAIIRENSQFFKWYGKIYRKSLSAFSHIFVLNQSSRMNLRMLGYTDVTVTGDPLFDNAVMIARTEWSDPVLGAFCNFQQVFMAGSVSDDKDIGLVAALGNRHPTLKMVVVPHEINDSEIEKIEDAFDGRCCRYSELEAHVADVLSDALEGVQVLILDTIGLLSKAYRYATWAYVGGGFTPLLHSVIEATVYGVPVSFGPRIERKVTPQQLIDRGLGAVVTDPEEIDAWYESLTSREKLDKVRRDALDYVEKCTGTASEIVETICSGLWKKS